MLFLFKKWGNVGVALGFVFWTQTPTYAAPPLRDYILFEYGVHVGAAHYFGDLNPDFKLNQPSYVLGLWGRYNWNDYLALRATVSFGHVGYSDSHYPESPFMRLRNLNFESNLLEFVLQGDFNFYAFIPNDRRYFFTTYVTLGAGVVHFDPYTHFQGKKYFLRDLGTEGQDVSGGKKAYSSWALAFPVGVGLKFNLARHVNIGIEFGYRFLTTDYLDDVSSTYVGANHFASHSIAQRLQDRSAEVAGASRLLGSAGKQRGDVYQLDGYAFASVFVSFNIIRRPSCPEEKGFRYKYKRSKKSYLNPEWVY